MKLKSKYQKEKEIALFYKNVYLKKTYGNKLPGK